MKPVSPALASVLRSGRNEFNARFTAARRLYPQLNGEAFLPLLETAVDELAQATERAHADGVADVVMAAYDAALELAGQNLVGPGSRVPCMEDAWRRILPKAARLVATAPARVIAAVCNAVHQLASTPGARPAHWIERMESCAPSCVDAEAFLKFGAVAAWRAGLAHYRKSALAAADALPEALALAAVGARSKTGWPAERERLRGNPWHDPGDGRDEAAGPRVVAQAGAFRGFGGLFVEPPVVTAAGEHFLVRSGEDCWLLTADLFGATFHRADGGGFDEAKREHRLPPAYQVSGEQVTVHGARIALPAPGACTSAAANDTTLALTMQFSHAVVLVAVQ